MTNSNVAWRRPRLLGCAFSRRPGHFVTTLGETCLRQIADVKNNVCASPRWTGYPEHGHKQLECDGVGRRHKRQCLRHERACSTPRKLGLQGLGGQIRARTISNKPSSATPPPEAKLLRSQLGPEQGTT
jgi:hypothetical protein